MVRAAAILALALVSPLAVAAAAPKAYFQAELAQAAADLPKTLRADPAIAKTVAAGDPAAALVADGTARLAAGDYAGAIMEAGAAIVRAPDLVDGYALFAETARVAVAKKSENAGRFVENGQAAAYATYVRDAAPATKARDLARLAELFADAATWRPALNAWRASLALAKDPSVAADYADARAKHGFRIVGYRIEKDRPAPRACFDFSERVAPDSDLSPYVAVAGNAKPAVSPAGRAVCVDGLEHGARYDVTLRKGLPAAPDIDERLLADAHYSFTVGDRAPAVRFDGRAYVLPRDGQNGVPLVVVGAGAVKIDAYRIDDANIVGQLGDAGRFLNQLDSYSARDVGASQGRKIWSGEIAVAAKPNDEVTTEVPVAKILADVLGKMPGKISGKPTPGLYVLQASLPAALGGDGAQPATQWLVVSDLGLTAFTGTDGLHASVDSLATAKPLAGVTLRLLARDHETLATATTDSYGRAAFAPGLVRGTGGARPSALVASTAAGDYDFLDLTASPFDLTDRGVGGDPSPGPLDALVFAERGVYRPGETVHAVALLRNAHGDAAAPTPLRIVVTRPDGVIDRTLDAPDGGLGGRAFDLALRAGAQAGTWRVAAYADPKGAPVGETTFLVEDYKPERIALKLTAPAAAVAPGGTMNVAIAADYLYGAPGAGLSATGDVRVSVTADGALPGPKGWQGGLLDERFDSVDAPIANAATTDALGRATIPAGVPAIGAKRPLEADVTVRVTDDGGAQTVRDLRAPLAGDGPWIGVKTGFADGAGDGGAASIPVEAVAPDGARIAMKGVKWALYELRDDYQWYEIGGRWRFESTPYSRKLAEGILDVPAGAPALIKTAFGTGRQRLALEGPDGARTSLRFSVGWDGGGKLDVPDLLQANLDKKAYAAGETAKLTLTARAAGRADVTIVGADGVVKQVSVDLAAGDDVVPIPVDARWGAGAYAIAIAHRPMDVAARHMPGRAVGVAWFSIDAAKRKLTVDLGGPDPQRPGGRIEIPVSVSGIAPGAEAYVTVSAVDVGILNLTHYSAPDPFAKFYGQKALSADMRDMYGLLIDGMQAVAAEVRGGGDQAAALAAPPPTQPPLALFSGVVKLDAQGRATIAFDVPAFDGLARVTAVAWSAGQVGAATRDVHVRDAVVVSGATPRFVSFRDASRLHLDLDDVDGPAGAYALSLAGEGPISIAATDEKRTLDLAPGKKAALDVPFAATGVGPAALVATLTGPGGYRVVRRFPFGVEPGAPRIDRRSVVSLAPGAKIALAGALLSDFAPGTAYVSVAASPFGGVDVGELLARLDRYPFGCTEQTVSRAMPLLYLADVEKAAHLPPEAGADGRIKDSIGRVLSRQSAQGAFGLWDSSDAAGDSADPWLSAYATDFLLRASARGFDVPPARLASALDWLRNYAANSKPQDDSSAQAIAYADYDLARAGRPVIADLRYAADAGVADYRTPLALAQLGAGLAALGDGQRAGRMFARAVATLQTRPDPAASEPNYGSPTRDGAAVLALIGEAKLAGADGLVQRADLAFSAQRAAYPWESTQDMAWTLLAAHALADRANSMAFEVADAPVKGALSLRYVASQFAGGPVAIVNRGATAALVSTTVSGRPLSPEPAESRDLSVERVWRDLSGKPVDPTKLKANERVVVTLTVHDSKPRPGRLMLVDRLPGGLEIENPKLVDGASAASFSWLPNAIQPTHVEYRDDRLLAAFDGGAGGKDGLSVSYVARATTPGTYVAPAATVEDMYRPERFGRSLAARIVVGRP